MWEDIIEYVVDMLVMLLEKCLQVIHYEPITFCNQDVYISMIDIEYFNWWEYNFTSPVRTWIN